MTPVESILKRSLEIHLKKREDYTTNPTANPFENFERSSQIANWFPDEYKSFGVLIGTKLARLGSLLQSGRAPNNESIDDTFLDLVTYCALMYGFYVSKSANQVHVSQLEQLGKIQGGFNPQIANWFPEEYKSFGVPKSTPAIWAPCDKHSFYVPTCTPCREANGLNTK